MNYYDYLQWIDILETDYWMWMIHPRTKIDAITNTQRQSHELQPILASYNSFTCWSSISRGWSHVQIHYASVKKES